jgi:hypothetical protein
VRLAIIPVIWGFVGGSAALLLDVRTDYVLLAAGVALVVARMTQRRHGSAAAGRGTDRMREIMTHDVLRGANGHADRL